MSKSQILKNLFGVLIIIIAGIFGGFIVASLASAVLILIKPKEKRLYFVLSLLLFTFFLSDDYRGIFSFAQNLRFSVLGLSLLVLLKYDLFKNNKAKLLLGFTVYTFLITLLFSPIGVSAILRSFGYLLVALVIFKILQILLDADRLSTINLIVTVFFSFFIVNLAVLILPIYAEAFNEDRFTGIMGNPNGLALLAIFSYALVYWIQSNEVSSFSKRFLSIFKVILFLLIIATGSRTSLLAILAFEVISRLYKNKLLLIPSVIGVVFLTVVLNSIAFEQVLVSLGLTDFLRLDTLETASGRTEVWGVAFAEFLNQPWLGRGMLYDDYFIQEYAEQRFGENNARNWNKVWNSYLSLALDVGIIGMSLFGYFWYRLFKASPDKVFRLAFMAMILISAVTESWMAASMNPFMPVVFLIWALQINRSKPLQKTVR